MAFADGDRQRIGVQFFVADAGKGGICDRGGRVMRHRVDEQFFVVLCRHVFDRSGDRGAASA